jgi:hypothetical protein
MTQKETIQVLQNKVQTLSTLVARSSLAKGLGLSFGGERDLYQALGYETSLTYTDYKRQYDRQDIAAAIINRPVETTWKGKLQLIESNDDNETEFERQWSKLAKTLKLKNRFVRLDKLTCLGKFAVLVLGLSDVKKQEDWQLPVKGTNLTLLYVKPFGEGSVKIQSYDINTASDRYGQPQIYQIDWKETTDGTNRTVLIHHSRVLHVCKSLLESEVEGEPVLQTVFNRLKDLEKIVGGSAEMFWRGARPGYHGDIDKDFQMTAAMEENLKDQIDEYENNLRRIITSQGLTMKDLASQVADPQSHVDVQIQMISSVTGIPKRVLTGTERGELASTQDDEAWLSLIQTRREEYAEEMIIDPFVERCQKYGVLPEVEEYTVLWNDLMTKSDKDKAEVGRVRAEALSKYLNSPMVEQVVPIKAFVEFFLGLEQDEIDLLNEMQKAAQD